MVLVSFDLWNVKLKRFIDCAYNLCLQGNSCLTRKNFRILALHMLAAAAPVRMLIEQQKNFRVARGRMVLTVYAIVNRS